MQLYTDTADVWIDIWCSIILHIDSLITQLHTVLVENRLPPLLAVIPPNHSSPLQMSAHELTFIVQNAHRTGRNSTRFSPTGATSTLQFASCSGFACCFSWAPPLPMSRTPCRTQ